MDSLDQSVLVITGVVFPNVVADLLQVAGSITQQSVGGVEHLDLLVENVADKNRTF